MLQGIGNALAGLSGGGQDKGLAGASPEEVKPQAAHNDHIPSTNLGADVDKAS